MREAHEILKLTSGPVPLSPSYLTRFDATHHALAKRVVELEEAILEHWHFKYLQESTHGLTVNMEWADEKLHRMIDKD